MFFWVFIILIILLISYLITNKIHVDWKSLFKAGFSKNDNAFGLYCYTGKQGTGKTYSCVNFLIKNKLEKNYIVITNVKSFNAFNDTIYLKDINQIIDFIENEEKKAFGSSKKYIIFFDEIFSILEKKTSLNKKILSFISQLRKRQIIFVTTAQEWSEINITFRRYVRFQVSCNMFSVPLLNRAFLLNKVNDGDGIKWDNDSQDWIAPTVQTNFMKGNLEVIESYDTFEVIDTGK